MPTFNYQFTVNGPIERVRRFHSSTDILKRLTPLPLFVQIHEFGEMAEGMIARFTIWFGPLPLRYRVIHIDVGENGFTDVQLEGPMADWRHTHRFEPLSAERTRIHEHIEYEFPRGLRGLFARLAFSKPALYGLFTYRRLVTTLGVRRAA